MIGNFLSPNSKSISVLIEPSAGFTKASYIFPTQLDLQNRKIIAIEAYCGEVDCIYDPNNSQSKTMPPFLFMNSFLTLYNASVGNRNMTNKQQEAGEFYSRIPMVKFRAMQNPYNTGGPQPSSAQGVYVIRPTEIEFTKTKVEFPTPIAIDQDYYATFVFHYLDKGDPGEWFMRALGFLAPSTGQ